MPSIPSISRHNVQGVLVRFFRNGDTYHPGVKIAINELELKSWGAFLNYLNRQPRLALVSGGIKHIYSLNGQEIRSINRFQNRQSYIVLATHSASFSSFSSFLFKNPLFSLFFGNYPLFPLFS